MEVEKRECELSPTPGPISEIKKDEKHVDFDTAITACGYGKFNYLMLLAMIPMTCSQLWSSGGTAYILPTAGCDLQLDEIQKGLLNAALYAGNIMAGVVWGVVGDKFGRQKLIMVTFFADFLTSFALGFVNSFWLFFAIKFLTGIIIAGPTTLLFTYTAETHNNDHRAQTIMCMGLGYSLAGVIHPVLAYGVLPLQLPGFSSWRVFLLLSSVPSLLSGALTALLPESPKFLLSQGRSEEALRVLGKIYALNSGKSPSHYPITSISCRETDSKDSSTQNEKTSGWTEQFKIILQRPYITRLALFVTIQVGLMICVNSVRLWTPQLFAFLDQYDMMPAEKKDSVNATTICGMISLSLAEQPTAIVEVAGAETSGCLPVSGDVYLRSLVIGAINIVMFLFAGPLVRRVGERLLALALFPMAAACSFALNWAGDADVLMALLGLYTPFMAISLNALSALQVDRFPTAIRALAMSVIIISGRIASLSGNLILPVLLNVSCEAVFFYLGGCIIFCCALTVAIPKTRETN